MNTINNNSGSTINASYYVAKIGDQYVAADGSLIDSQRTAFRMADDDRIPEMRSVLDSFYLMSRIPAIPADRRLRLVRVNPKSAVDSSSVVDSSDDDTYYNDDADRAIDTNDGDDRPFVHVIKNAFDQYYAGSDCTFVDQQRDAFWFPDRADAQQTIDRELGSDVRIVRVRLNSDAAIARYTELTAPIAAAAIDDMNAIDPSAFYVAKSGDLYLSIDGSLVRYQRQARRFDTKRAAQDAIGSALLADGRIVKVNRR